MLLVVKVSLLRVIDILAGLAGHHVNGGHERRRHLDGIVFVGDRGGRTSRPSLAAVRFLLAYHHNIAIHVDVVICSSLALDLLLSIRMQLVGRGNADNTVNESVIVIVLFRMVYDGTGRVQFVQAVQSYWVEVEQFLLFVLEPSGVQIHEWGDTVQ